ncbi:MAG TPA: ABC transporter permease, partial [Solirubrobacterales bacterium]|nr:ABC transporter permease [Solirubrobacterales bacterium]
EENLLVGLQGSGAEHLLGTDEAGRDVLSRIMAGARSAIVGPIVVVLGAMAIGTFFGLMAGYRGGWVDSAVMRVVDLLYSLPGLLIAIVALGVFGGGYWVAVAILIVLTSPFDTRLIRGAALEQSGLPYVDAARTLGLPPRRIMTRHIWPNIAPLIVANSFLNFAFTLVALTSLAFLGLGAGPGATDWGQMLKENLAVIEINPWASLGPGLAIVLLALSMNLIGDWIFERLSDRGMGR